MAPATALWIVNELLTKYQTNTDYATLINTIDIWVAPSLNPDGYEFTRSSNRLWRKTRCFPVFSKVILLNGDIVEVALATDVTVNRLHKLIFQQKFTVDFFGCRC